MENLCDCTIRKCPHFLWIYFVKKNTFTIFSQEFYTLYMEFLEPIHQRAVFRSPSYLFQAKSKPKKQHQARTNNLLWKLWSWVARTFLYFSFRRSVRWMTQQGLEQLLEKTTNFLQEQSIRITVYHWVLMVICSLMSLICFENCVSRSWVSRCDPARVLEETKIFPALRTGQFSTYCFFLPILQAYTDF